MPLKPDVDNPEQEGESPGWQRLNTASVRRIEQIAERRIGQTLAGRFRLERVIAIGGMATVYEATQAPLMRRVAVKILHPTEIEAGRTEYFLREANSAAGLRHPNVISIVDFGQEDDGTLFLAMEYVPGVTFSELLAQNYPLSTPRLMHIMEQVCLALEVAHHANVVHCDMKPSNIMIEEVPGNPDHVKVLDFGISRQAVKDPAETQTQSDEIIGSYYYMAPEQIRGRAVTARTDVYGLGVVLYTALTAAFPFDEEDDAALMDAILMQLPMPPSMVRPELNIPAALDAIVLKAMAKRPEERFESSSALRRALLNLDNDTSLSDATLSGSGPNSLELLIPDEDLFDIEVDVKHDSDAVISDLLNSELDEVALDAAAMQPLRTGSLKSLSEAPPPPALHIEAPAAGHFNTVLSGRPSIIGRREELTILQRAALMTRRGVVTMHVTGNYGCGSSFFVNRAIELLGTDLDATVLMTELHQDARETAFRTLYHLICHGLDEHLSPQDSSVEASQGPALIDRRQIALRKLKLGHVEHTALMALLRRWTLAAGMTQGPVHLEEWRPYDGGPLRFPETRSQILSHAFSQMLRALVQKQQTTDETTGHRAPLLLCVDGWEHCDSATRRVLRNVLSKRRDLPLLFIAVTQNNRQHAENPFPETIEEPDQLSPYNDRRPWDLEISIPPYDQQEVHQYLLQHQGMPPGEALVERLTHISEGNPLLLKEILHFQRNARQGSWRLPESADRMFAMQLDKLSRDGKMLLAVCTLLGASFPQAAVHAIMPAAFDVSGTFAELMGARLLEPISSDSIRLRFRFPRMRGVALRRLHPRLRQGLHSRIVKLLRAREMPISAHEAELWMATHSMRSGAPLTALDSLLEAAQRAMDRWEPELSLRRCRQAQTWLTACLAQQHDGDIVVLGQHQSTDSDDGASSSHTEFAARTEPREFESRGMLATQLLLNAARRLQIPPARHQHAIIAEKLPQSFLDQVRDKNYLSTTPRALAALAVGRYFSRLELPQSARSALQLATHLARQSPDTHLSLQVELEMVRNLHRLGRHGQATDVAKTLIDKLRDISLGPGLPQLSLSKPLDLLARVYIGRRLYARAEHTLDQARAVAERADDHDQLCKIHLHYAALYRAQSQHPHTLQALNSAHQVAARSHDLRSQARVLYNMGITSANLGHRQEGRRHLSDAIELAINLGWTDFVALVNGQLKKL